MPLKLSPALFSKFRAGFPNPFRPKSPLQMKTIHGQNHLPKSFWKLPLYKSHAHPHSSNSQGFHLLSRFQLQWNAVRNTELFVTGHILSKYRSLHSKITFDTASHSYYKRLVRLRKSSKTKQNKKNPQTQICGLHAVLTWGHTTDWVLGRITSTDKL